MFLPKLVFAVLSCAALMGAQALPAGTALPIAVGSSLNAKSVKAGQKIEGKLMQEVRLPSNAILKKGSRLTGHVVSANKPGAKGSSIVVQFDQLQNDKQTIALNVSLRALASSADVFNAGLPTGPSSTGEFSGNWITRQVGGELVFRGRGYVASAEGKVGIWSGSGVWGKLQPAADCPASDGNGEEQALWIFSTTACGTYGLEDVKLASAGRTDPMGQITLESPKDIEIRGGSAWLLLVNATPAAGK
jgi:hypothetical protein